MVYDDATHLQFNVIMQGTEEKFTNFGFVLLVVGGSLKIGTMISITVNNYLGKQKDPTKVH